eukprot:1680516-Pleurochrysis_carterae.AAC.4
MGERPRRRRHHVRPPGTGGERLALARLAARGADAHAAPSAVEGPVRLVEHVLHEHLRRLALLRRCSAGALRHWRLARGVHVPSRPRPLHAHVLPDLATEAAARRVGRGRAGREGLAPRQHDTAMGRGESGCGASVCEALLHHGEPAPNERASAAARVSQRHRSGAPEVGMACVPYRGALLALACFTASCEWTCPTMMP